MGNIELKQAFKNANANVNGKSLSLDLASDEKIVNELYQYVSTSIVSADKVKIEKLFPDSNVQNNRGDAEGGEGIS